MSFKGQLYSSYSPNPTIDGAWGWQHIVTLGVCAVAVVLLSLLFRKKSEKAKRILLWIFAAIILAFGIVRRVVGFIKEPNPDFTKIMYILLPRPGCAIACWAVVIAVVFNKKSLYNFASILGILCGIIFFAYPGAGFNKEVYVFENYYSIFTHSLFFVSSLLFITLGFTEFRYKGSWKEAIYLIALYVYSILQIYVLKISADPMYFMPGGDIQAMVGLNYTTYIALYVVFMIVYFNLFYLIGDRKSVFKRRKK